MTRSILLFGALTISFASLSKTVELQEFNPNKTYTGGDVILFEEKPFIAKHWAKGGTPSSDGAWTEIANFNSPQEYAPGNTYKTADVVMFNNEKLVARHWTQAAPEVITDWGPWVKVNEPIGDLVQGRLVDSSVYNARYRTTSGLSGRTGINGGFKYRKGDKVSFYVGSVHIGTLKGDELISVLDFDHAGKAALFLQSIDKDGNLRNGIEITESDFKKLENADFEISAVDAKDPGFQKKFKSYFGYEMQIDEYEAKVHALETLKHEIIKALEPEFPEYLSGKIGVEGFYGSDIPRGKIYGKDPNESVTTIQSRLRLYYYFTAAQRLLKFDEEFLQGKIKSGEVTREHIEKETRRLISFYINSYKTVMTLKTGVGDIQRLSSYKKAIQKGGVSFYAGEPAGKLAKYNYSIETARIGGQYLLRGALNEVKNEVDKYANTAIGRVLSTCIFDILDPEFLTKSRKLSAYDMMPCVAESTSELALSLHNLYSTGIKLQTIRQYNALLVTKEYLAHYYLFDRNSSNDFTDFLNSFAYEHLGSEAKTQKYFGDFYNHKDLVQREKAINLISKVFFNKKRLIGGALEVDFDDVNKYMNLVEDATADFVNAFNEVSNESLQFLDNEYLEVQTYLKAQGNNNFKACSKIVNYSAFRLKDVDVQLEYKISNGQAGVEKQFYNNWDRVFDQSKQICTRSFNVDVNQISDLSNLMELKYSIDYTPDRPGVLTRKQTGVDYLKLDAENALYSLQKPQINIRDYKRVYDQFEPVVIDARNSGTHIPNDFIIHKWRLISSGGLNIQFDKYASKLEFTIPEYTSNKRYTRVQLMLTVKSEKSGNYAAKRVSFFVRKPKDTLPPSHDLSHIRQSNYKNSLLKPRSGDVLKAGQKYNVTWRSNKLSGSKVDLYVLHDDPTGVEGGNSANATVVKRRNWYKFASGIPNNGYFKFDAEIMHGNGNAYKVLVISSGGSWSVSNGLFTLSR